MRAITFNLRPVVDTEDRQRLFNSLSELKGIKKTAALRPGSSNAAVRRICYAQVSDDADIESLRDAIAARPEVESASVPATRELLGD
ncbi:MAG: hypothetical protein AB7U73_15690 [Pirellulales bacterium]